MPGERLPHFRTLHLPALAEGPNAETYFHDTRNNFVPRCNARAMRGNAEAIETHGVRFLSGYGRDLTSDESDLCRGIEVLTRDRQRELRDRRARAVPMGMAVGWRTLVAEVVNC